MVLQDTIHNSAGEKELHHIERLEKAINNDDLELAEIRSLAFHGIPDGNASYRHMRPICWRLFLGLLPPDKTTWDATLSAKRQEFQLLKHKTESDHLLKSDIEKDVNRTQGSISFFATDSPTNEMMVSILLIYAKETPDIKYVQGMNEILAPLIYVFGSDPDHEEWSAHAEADSYYCFCTIMNHLKKLYIETSENNNVVQTGIQIQMQRLSRLIHQHDKLLWDHLQKIGLSTSFYSYRWYSALLSREFMLPDLLRVWDSLLSDPNRFVFLHYVCCALVLSQRQFLMNSDFDSGIQCLQRLENVAVDEILSAAVKLRSIDRFTKR